MVHSAFRLLGIAIVSGRGNSTATLVAEIVLTRHAAPLSESSKFFCPGAQKRKERRRKSAFLL